MIDFGGGELGVLPISCSLKRLFGESDLARTQNGIRGIFGRCLGHAGCYIWLPLLKLHESSSLLVQTWDLIWADDCPDD